MSYSRCYNFSATAPRVVPVKLSPEGIPIELQVLDWAFKEERVPAVAAVIDGQFG